MDVDRACKEPVEQPQGDLDEVVGLFGWIFEKPVGKIPRSVHNPFDTESLAIHVKEQVPVERLLHLNTSNVREFRSLKVAAATEVGPYGDPLNGFMDRLR